MSLSRLTLFATILALITAVFAGAQLATAETLATAGSPPAAEAEADPQAAASESAAVVADQPSMAMRIWVFLGVFHPLVVHFPIALLLLAATVELARFIGLLNVSRDVTWICLLGGALTAILAAALGWANATDLSESPTLATHRWLGIGMTALAVGLAAVTTFQRYRPHITPGKLYLTLLALLAAGVGFTGHLGGQLVYGDDFIERAWRQVTQPPRPTVAAVTPDTNTDADADGPASHDADPDTDAADTASSADAELDLDDPDARVDFAQHVWPILESKCIECHGPEESEGRLRLDTEEAALRGGRGGPAYIAGDPDFSLMIEMIASPFESDIMPPPEHNNPVSDEELATLERWIEQGAKWNLPEDEQP